MLSHPVAVVVDVDVGVLVHGGKGGSMFQLLRGQPAVHHVVMKSVQQLDVHVAHQSIQDLLQQDDRDTLITAAGYSERRDGGRGRYQPQAGRPRPHYWERRR